VLEGILVVEISSLVRIFKTKSFEPRSNTLRSEGRLAVGSRSSRETLLAKLSLVRINYRAIALLSYLLFNIEIFFLFKPAKTI